MITSNARVSTSATRPRISRLRFLELKSCRRLGGREDEQQPAVVVVGGEDVRLGLFRPIALGMNGDRLVEHAHSPLERGAYVVVAGGELETQHLLHGTPDHV